MNCQRVTILRFGCLGSHSPRLGAQCSGDTAEGISWIEQGIEDYRASGLTLGMPSLLALKAEALHLADRTSEALEAIREAEAMAEISEERFWCAELHRLRGVFLAAMGADETQIEASFCEAIRIAKEQKSISLEKRAEANYAEYRRQKASSVRTRRIPTTSLVTPKIEYVNLEIILRDYWVDILRGRAEHSNLSFAVSNNQMM